MANNGLEILVSYAEFDEAEKKFTTASNELEGILNQMNNLVAQLSEHWDSIAAQKFILKITEEMKEVRKAQEKVDAYKAVVPQIAQQYAEAEAVLSGNTGALSAGGIF